MADLDPTRRVFGAAMGILRRAFSLEFLTDAGRVNFFGSVFMVVLVIVLAASTAVPDIGAFILIMTGHPASFSEWNPLLLFSLFGLYLVFCVVMLFLLERGRKDPS